MSTNASLKPIRKIVNTNWAKARVLEASDRGYLKIVLEILKRARREIILSLYLIEPNEAAGPMHPVNRLLQALLDASGRGVRVKIYLNTNVRFLPKTTVGTGNYFERLAEAGAELTALLPRKRLHDKLLVIDGRYIVEGSMNWSESALESNYESVSVIDSPAHARKKLKRVAELSLPPRLRADINRPLLPLPETIEVPAALFGPDFLARMVREADQRSLDLYLILIAQSQAQKSSPFEMDLETLGLAVGLPADWTRSKIRRQVIKTLKKLESRYGLIEAEFPYGQDARVMVKPFEGKRIEAPAAWFDSQTLASESSTVTFLKFAGELLKSEGENVEALSAPELERRFGIGKSSVVRARRRR